MSEMKTGGQIIWESLIHEGVDVVFGLPGGTILPTYDELYKHNYPIHHVLVTHEQGGAHMADGAAKKATLDREVFFEVAHFEQHI